MRENEAGQNFANPSFSREFLKKTSVKSSISTTQTALSIASKEGYSEIALKLLKAGAHTNLQDRGGDTCLIYASKGGYKTIVEALLKKYAADVDIKGKDGKTCLQGAIDKNHTDIVRILLTANPDLESRSNEGDTALLHAARVRNPEIVHLLLEKKAKPYAANKNNDTALHIAMRAKSKAVVEVLLRNPKHSQYLYKPNNKVSCKIQLLFHTYHSERTPFSFMPLGRVLASKALLAKLTLKGFSL